MKTWTKNCAVCLNLKISDSERHSVCSQVRERRFLTVFGKLREKSGNLEDTIMEEKKSGPHKSLTLCGSRQVRCDIPAFYSKYGDFRLLSPSFLPTVLPILQLGERLVFGLLEILLCIK